jgi:Flp pilus assembly protein CpaB
MQLGARPAWWRGPRGRRARRAVGVVVAVVVLVVTWSLCVQARHAVDAYGQLRRVALTRRRLAVGEQIEAPDIAWRDLPRAAVPAHAVVASPVGRVLLAPLDAGQIVTTTDLAPEGLHGLAALVPRDQRAVSVPVPDGGLPLEVGDHVDVLAPEREGSDRTTVAERAAVLAVLPRSVVLAVSSSDAGAIADALARGTPVLALDGPG